MEAEKVESLEQQLSAYTLAQALLTSMKVVATAEMALEKIMDIDRSLYACPWNASANSKVIAQEALERIRGKK